jgi:hypothetical protein
MKEETPPRRREGGKKVGFSVEFVTTSVTLTGEEIMKSHYCQTEESLLECNVTVKATTVKFSIKLSQWKFRK